MNKLILFALGIAVVIGFTGCEKATVVSTATADVFIRSIKSPKDTSISVYSVVHTVISYDLMANVSVVAPNGVTSQLVDYDKLGNSFYNLVADSLYSPTPPTPGTYNYTVTFKDKEVITYSNSLSSSYITAPTITSLVKAVADTIYLKWNAVANADGYQIKITKLDTITKVVTQLKYIQPFTDSSTPKKAKLYFSLPRSYFSLLLNNTETYSVQLDALLFENSTSTYLQAIGTASRNIKF
ncbi:MAG: hypothetical protein WCJ95_07320 [Mariniphaga sp.]